MYVRPGGRRTRAAATLLALLVGAAPALADERDDRIRELERQAEEFRARQERMEREIADLRAGAATSGDGAALERAVADIVRNLDSDAGYAGPAGVRRPSAALQIGGYFSTRYVSSQLPGEHNSFVDMRLVPQIHADITPRIHFDTEIEVEHGGVSDEVDGEIVVEYAELSFEIDPAFVFKAGTLLIPFGHFNLNHDDPMNELSERPRVARYVVPSAFDIPGIGAEGVIEAPGGVLLYDVALTNGFKDEFDSEDGTREARGLFDEDDNSDKTVFGRVAFAPTESWFDAFSIAASGAFGRIGEDHRGDHRLTGWGVDAQAKQGPWEFMGEWDAFDVDRAPGAGWTRLPNGDVGAVRGVKGWYGQLLYRIDAPWVRCLPVAEDDATVGLVVRHDHVNLNDRLRGASPQDDERAWTFGINYRPSAKTVVKLEYRFADSPFDGPEGRKRDFFALEFATYF